MARQNVFIFGATGNVGSELVRQILLHDAPASRLSGTLVHENPTVIVGVANRLGFWIDPDGIPIGAKELEPFADIDFNNPDRAEEEHSRSDQWKDFLKARFESATEWDTWEGYKPTRATTVTGVDRALLHLRAEGLAGDVILIDATADERTMPSFHQKVIGETDYAIVTANKHPVASFSCATFKQLTTVRGRYGLRSTVMGGAQVVSHLMELYDSDEHVVRVDACLSGSLGYICSEMQRGERKFSEILQTAIALKYTEPDPREDLSGMDVARKLTIVARCLGFNVELGNVKVRGFVDDKYKDLPLRDFLLAMASEEDGVMQERFSGRLMRYVATLEAHDAPTEKPKRLEVSLQEVPKESALASVKGTANVISIQSRTFAKGKEYVIRAPGAGVDVTASGIRRDLLGMLRRRKSGGYFI